MECPLSRKALYESIQARLQEHFYHLVDYVSAVSTHRGRKARLDVLSSHQTKP